MRTPTLFVIAALVVFLFGCTRPAEVSRMEPLPEGGGATVEVKDQPLPEWDGKSWAIHEWGTFTGVQGSDGVVLDGLSHEETDLPEFVHDIRDFTGITGVSPKMETPVIYFYGTETRRVDVGVKFPRGVITQWYPAAHNVNLLGMVANGTASDPDGREITDLRDGYINWGDWRDLRVLAPGQEKDTVSDSKGMRTEVAIELPEVADDDPWRFCREVDANTIKVCSLNAGRAVDGGSAQRVVNEYEKCLFYRGLGDFTLPLKAEAGDEELLYAEGEERMHVMRPNAVKLNVKLTNLNPAEPLTHVMLVYRDRNSSRTGYHYIESIGNSVDLKDVEVPLTSGGDATAEALVAKLVETGLYGKEARAMVNTWRDGYIDHEGLRVLYVLPQAFVERELPLTISGWGEKKDSRILAAPVTRTFVARQELLTPAREAQIEATIKNIALYPDSRDAALAEMDTWGRFAIPYLNRAKALATDAQVLAEIDARLDALKLKR